MKIFTNILILLVLLFISQSIYSQDTPNFDDYILDTIIQQSEIDSTIIDTFIIARKKVIIKKEVVVENQIFITPVFNDILFSTFASPVWSFNSDISFKNENVNYKISPALGFEAGIGIQTSIKKKIETSLVFLYNQYNENFDFISYTYTPKEKDSLVVDTLETYFINNIPIHITETRIQTVRDTTISSSHTKSNNKYHSISIEFCLGKKIILKYFQICPTVSAAYQYTFLQKGFITNSSYSLLNLTDQNNYSNFKIGLKADMILPIKNNLGIKISPHISFFSQKRNPLYNSIDKEFGILFGVFYKII